MLSPRQLFLAGRGISTFASLGLALIYSQDLGQVNRSVLALIMSTNALLWIVLTSGTTLTLRKIGWGNLSKQLCNSFFSLAVAQLLVIVLIFLAVLRLYSNLKNQIPIDITLIAIVYVTFSGLHLIVMELLVSNSSFRLIALLDISTIALQYLVYFLGRSSEQNSNVSWILVAYLFSYLLIGSLGVIVLLLRKKIEFGFVSPKAFLNQSKYNHSIGTSIGLMDRADRLVIGFSLETPILGKYAVTSSIIALLRFLPDSIARLLIAKENFQKWGVLGNKYFISSSILTLPFVAIGVARFVVENWLGSEWLIAINICLVIALQELLRGFYVILANKKIGLGFSRNVNSSSIMLPILAIALSQLFLGQIGLIAVPTGFAIAYGVSIIRLLRNKKL